MRAIIAVLIALFPAFGCAQISGNVQINGTTYLNPALSSPAISNVQTTSSDHTIAVSFTSSSFATPSLACGTSAGSYTNAAVDNGIDVDSSLHHVQVVKGLQPATTYYCQYGAANTVATVTGTFTLATTAAAASTPVTGATLGTVSTYNAINGSNQGRGDTYYNCKSNDGRTYITTDDSTGYQVSGVPAFNYSGTGGQMVLNVFQSESPWVIQTVNFFNSYGYPGVYLSDGLSSKNTGLFCMDGKLFLAYGRQLQGAGQTGGALHQTVGNVMWSPDHGVSWNNPQEEDNFASVPTNPLSYSMFAGSPSSFASAEFVHYCADDGTLGYFDPCNQHDQGDAYVYLIANEGTWNGGGTAGGGNAFYLARVPRAKLQNLKGSDYQFYVSGDGTLDASWSSTEANAQPILSNAGKLGEPNVQYIPALNRYVLLTFYYPSGVIGSTLNLNDCAWLIYESRYPWGPWTPIFSQDFNTSPGGDYNPVILSDTAFTGTSPTIMWTANVNDPNYIMRFATLTLTH